MGDQLHPCVCWDFHQDIVGAYAADMSHCYVESSTPPFLSPFESDVSTGYLQDALFEFTSKKRRRLLLFSDNNDQIIQTTTATHHDLTKCCWYSNNSLNDAAESFSPLSQMTNIFDISGETSSSRSESRMSEDAFTNTEEKTAEEVISASDQTLHCSSTSHKHLPVDKHTLCSIDGLVPAGCDEKRKKRMITRVVYPFAVVKPGGIEGNMTLRDINERILMPPTRPVRHPVGDFACRPLVSPDGPGLSGKAVVALTRIQTQGRGTITIIRTRD